MHVCVGRPAKAPPVVLVRPGPVRQNRRMETAPAFYHVNVFAEYPGGCYTCRWFGERVDVTVACAHPRGEHVRSQAERGCAFWEREPGAGDDLLAPVLRSVWIASERHPG